MVYWVSSNVLAVRTSDCFRAVVFCHSFVPPNLSWVYVGSSNLRSSTSTAFRQIALVGYYEMTVPNSPIGMCLFVARIIAYLSIYSPPYASNGSLKRQVAIQVLGETHIISPLIIRRLECQSVWCALKSPIPIVFSRWKMDIALVAVKKNKTNTLRSGKFERMGEK